MPTGRVRLFAGNRLERLADLLVDRMSAGDPLSGAVVVVRSRGMATWLERRIADRAGVSFGNRFPFPRHLLMEAVRTLVPGRPPDPAFEPGRLTWRILAELRRGAESGTGPGSRFREYLADDPSGLRGYQVAARLARLFDDYLAYRPEWLAAWEGESVPPDAAPPEDADAAWQSDLWRRLVAGASDRHPARLARELFAVLETGTGDVAGFPGRVSVFGITAMPPVHMRLLEALSRRIDVDLYRLDSGPEIGERAGASGVAGRVARRLVAAWGRGASDAHLRMSGPGWRRDPAAASEIPPAGRLLGDLQRVLAGAEIPTEIAGEADDDSVRIHVCHGPLRELRVLRDHLLHWFRRDGLKPGEVLVLAPRIERYVPFLDAVMGAQPDGGPRIPWSVADRPRGPAAGPAGAFLALLALAGSRLTAGAVLAFMEQPAVRRRLGFEAADLAVIARWLVDAPVWWGLDGAARAALGMGDEATGTWRRGVDRILLGHAMDPRTAGVVGGIRPMEGAAGESAELAGRLAEFLASLEARFAGWHGARTPGAWAVELRSALGAFFEADREDAAALETVRDALGELAQAGDAVAVELRVVAESLRCALETADESGGFLAAGVTFGALQPMRSVPARAVCVLGLDDDAFPRRPASSEFDLIAAHPQPGDAPRADDDRLLFLETVLSARERLYLSHSGLSPRDNTEAPPSVVVSDLLEAVAELRGDPAAAALVVRHRLHGWSRAYFGDDPRLFTYSRGAAEAARLVAGPRGGRTAFCPRPLPARDADTDGPRRIGLDEFRRFLVSPARYFCERRPGLRLERAAESPSDREPFDLEGLGRHGLRTRMLDHLLGGGTAEDMPVEAWRAEGRVPPGGFAETRLRVETRLLVEFARAVGEEFGDTIPEAQEVSLRVGRHELAGRTVPCGPLGPVLYRPGGARPKDEFALWVELLVAAAARRARPDPGGPFEARLLHISDGKAASTAYAEPENPEALLGVLLEAFVHAERFPIPLLPGAGLAYARQVKHGREAALRAALDAWTGNDFAKADSEDPYAELCFGHDPVGGRFGEIAEAVFVPMHAARVDRRRAKDGESRTSRRGKAGR